MNPWELRAAKARVRQAGFDRACAQIAHRDGQLAFARGLTLDDNPRRTQSLRAEWARGWHAAQRAHQDHAKPTQPTAANLAAAEIELMKIRRILESK